MALERISVDSEACKIYLSSIDDYGDPAITERTPLLAGPSCKASYIQLPGAVSSCSGVSPTNTDALRSCDLSGSCQSPERSNGRGNAYRHRSLSQGHDHDQGNSRSSSTTVHNRSEICAASSDPFPTSSPERPFFTSLPQSISLHLENSGSVARDHLASERTFLAYMRTSLAIASSGVALVQLFSAAAASIPKESTHRLHRYIRPLGASAVLIGLLVLFIGVTRYFTIQAALTKGYFPVARLATGFIAVVLTALVTLTFAILMAGKLEAKQA